MQGYKDISEKGGRLCAGRMAARGLAEGGENQGKTQTRDTMESDRMGNTTHPMGGDLLYI